MSNLADALAAPFQPHRVSWRIGSTTKDKARGMALAYVDARDVMERLDEVCGVEGWQNRYSHTEGKTVCEIAIKVNDEWIWKADGAGDSDIEAEKGALSDAFKRAAVRWGVGRYLYDTASPWVELESKGSSHVIPDRELARLRQFLGNQRPQAAEKPDAAEPTQSVAAAAQAAPALRPTPAQTKLYGRMLLDLNQIKTPQAVADWAANGVVAADFADLPESLQADLKAAMQRHRKKLTAVPA